MFLTLLSNKPNSGQSITAINLADILHSNSGEKSLLVDTHSHNSSQIEEYLSKNEINNGFDNFINRFNMKKNSRETFQYCRNNVSESIDFMALSRVTLIEDEHVAELIKITTTVEEGYSSPLYGNVIVDYDITNPKLSRSFLSESDYIILIVEQNSYSLSSIDEMLRSYSDKLLLLVNKYDYEVKYSTSIMAKEIDFNPYAILTLPYSPLIPNSINGENVIGISKNSKYLKSNYYSDLQKLAEALGVSIPAKTKRSFFSL